MMRFLIALQFLTIIPVRIKDKFGEKELSRSMLFFPIVGLLLGLALAGIRHVTSLILPPQATSAIVIMALSGLTGGLHLDGLADTADALFSSRNKKEKLRIMKKSDIGAMGASAIVLTLILKVALVGSIPVAAAFKTLILFPAAGRCGLLLPARIFKYAREEGGTGEAFVSNLSWPTVVPATIATGAIAAGLMQAPGACALAAALIAAVSAGGVIALKIGGMTGDTLGAINEIGEIVFLASACVLSNCERLNTVL